MNIILTLGVILLLGGILFIFIPSAIFKLNQFGQKHIFGEGEVVKNRIQTGILLLITGILMVLMYIKWGN